MEKMTCPICGRSFDEKDMSFLENGNPACFECVEKEQSKSETTSNTKPSKKICGNCKAEIPFEKDFCPKCGKKYIPFICGKCKNEITTPTKFCPSCGHKIRSQKEKKKRKIIIVSASALILTICLVLFIPYETTDSCPLCVGGRDECRVKKYTEMLSGQPQYGHDCSNCVNGYAECVFCDGTGLKREKKTNFQRWF